MTKADLLNLIVSKVDGLAKNKAGDIVDVVFACVSEALCKENRFSYPCFGTFTVKERAERDGRNPRTNEPIKIAACKSVSFKAAPKLKEALNPDAKKADKKADAKKADAKKADAKKAPAKKAKK